MTKSPDERSPGKAEPKRREQVEQALDDALADSFPASDPVSIVTSQREEAWEPDSEVERKRERTPER